MNSRGRGVTIKKRFPEQLYHLRNDLVSNTWPPVREPRSVTHLAVKATSVPVTGLKTRPSFVRRPCIFGLSIYIDTAASGFGFSPHFLNVLAISWDNSSLLYWLVLPSSSLLSSLRLQSAILYPATALGTRISAVSIHLICYFVNVWHSDPHKSIGIAVTL